MHSPNWTETHQLPFDTYPDLLTWFFELDEFENWIEKGRTFQLRCVGGPGSGKTTLSALAVDYLRERFDNKNEAVASIFFHTDVNCDETNSLEQLLDSLYRQFSRNTAVDDLSGCVYKSYLVARKNGKKTSRQLLRKALYSRLSSLERAFLVVDDLDSYKDNSILEEEFSRLQFHGLSILVTSRIPFRRSTRIFTCDCPDHPRRHKKKPLPVFWWCQLCKDDNFIICPSCKEKGHVCGKCGEGGFLVEPYQQVDYDITIDPESMTSFVSWSLENEHGELGLESTEDEKPPLSALGRQIQKQSSGSGASELVQSIVDRADGNVGIAKLLLEQTHEAQTVGEALAIGDRLSSNIVAYFDACIARIEEQPKALRDIGMKAIAAAACTDLEHKPFAQLKADILASTTGPDEALVASLNIDQVIYATRGLLVQHKRSLLGAFHPFFGYYARENYNAALFWEHMTMRCDMPVHGKTMEFSGMGKTKTAGAGKFLKTRKRISAVGRMLLPTRKSGFRMDRAFKITRRITGMF